MEKVLSDIPLPVIPGIANTKEYIMKLHQQLPDKRSKIIINIVNNNVTVENLIPQTVLRITREDIWEYPIESIFGKQILETHF